MCVGWVGGGLARCKIYKKPKRDADIMRGVGMGRKGEMSEMKGLKPYGGSLSFEKWASK
jgi:hypothetical protein